MARGDPPMPLESLVPYFRGARFANVAMKLRHGDCVNLGPDADRYIEMCDRYSQAAVATFRLRRQREAARGASG